MRPVLLWLPLFIAGPALLFTPTPNARSAGVVKRPAPVAAWRVEDLRTGMKGTGRTVLKGTRIETFQVELLGVLRNSSPGRDMILAKLSGIGLDRSGVIAGMSGSPVYIDGKLVGAVAYAWPHGKDPIAGITPFVQMQSFADAVERRVAERKVEPKRFGLNRPVLVGDKSFESVTVSQELPEAAEEGLWMAPLRTPLSSTGFTKHSLDLLARETRRYGLVPVAGGAATARVAEEEREVRIEPGSSLSLALVTGDFDMSGVGTTTHVEGRRVWGWGHPFMSLGGCRLPMMTGFIHTIYPRQTVSFKMGSPLRIVGVVNADVSTCIAGVLGDGPEMLPMRMTTSIGNGEERVFNVNVARQRSLMSSLIYSCLTNSADMEGELPEEMTARLHARVELEGGQVIEVRDTFSGMSGGRAPAILYGSVASTVSMLNYNPHESLTIKRVEATTHIEAGRTSAEIEAMQLSKAKYAPGDEVEATVLLRPWRGERKRVTVKAKLPDDLPEGEYSAIVMDEPTNARDDVRGNPSLLYPTTVERTLAALKVLTAARRTTLALRVPLGASGVSTNGRPLPNLPGSAVKILAGGKRTGTMPISKSAVGRTPTGWVIQGADSMKFTVRR